MKIVLEGKSVKISSQAGFDRLVDNHQVQCLLEYEGEGDDRKSCEIADFESLEANGTYHFGPKQEKAGLPPATHPRAVSAPLASFRRNYIYLRLVLS